MWRIRGKNRARIVVVALVAGLSVSMAATPAHADHLNSGLLGDYLVDGANTVTDDWGDHFDELGYLCYGCAHSWNTDLVVMWQAILYSERLISAGDIDGKFGPTTQAATKKWQSRYGLTADGIVGDRTWGRADNELVGGGGSYVLYKSDHPGTGDVRFSRGDRSIDGDDGAYELLSTYNLTAGGTVVFDSIYHQIFFESRTITRR